MIQVLRLFAFYCLGVFLGGWSVWAMAETIPASYGNVDNPVQYRRTSASTYYATTTQVCAAYGLVVGGNGMQCYSTGGFAQWDIARGCPTGAGSYVTVDGQHYCRLSNQYYCPSGQSWTLSGQTCTRPDCVAPLTRQSDGTCRGSCTNIAGFSQYGISGEAFAVNGENTDSLCRDGCKYSTSGCVKLGGTWWCTAGKSTGQSCSGTMEGTNGVPETTEPESPKVTDQTANDCIKQGMAWGTANGQTICVAPETTQQKNTTTQTTTRPDGTTGTQTTTTVTTCTGAGSCTTTTNSTVSGGGASGTQPNGTTTTTTEGDEAGACAINPGNPICQPGFKKPGKGKFDSKESDITQAKQALTDKVNEVKAQITGMFGALSTGSGGLSCDQGVSLASLGIDFRLCFASQESNLSPIPVAVMVIAALISLFIIFG